MVDQPIESPPAASVDADFDLATLEAVERRVLWLASSIIHHANKVRETPAGVKVGGHQASSASMVGIMTALYFEHLSAADRVSVKPHAAPVLHAINHLLGELDPAYLTELRAFGGLQSYPSRTKDPEPVGAIEQWAPPARSRSRPNALPESKRGRQHHSIAPWRETSAAVWQSPISA